MRSWQNGTRCRDGVKVLWCPSHLVWLVFELPSLHALVFIQKTFSDLFLLLFFFFVLSFRNGKREERWEGKTHGQLFCSQQTKNHHKLKCFQVKL